ncbi:MAG: hypothetical protein IJ416_02680 [Ruminiclostridium sp.]|nr:hypothetical protein [Ruminiclostridium sp.]
MRIAGSTIRRNYLKNYEMNSSAKFDSEQKIQTGRQFQRASESPINAAKALRVRKSLAELETQKKNLQSADSIYQVAESSLLTISEIIQNTYEKLVEGAHGTRNQNDCDIIATEIEQYAEEMVQMLNVDVADRKIFGGVNNTTNAFEIKGELGTQYVTYNGIPVNASSDPFSFPDSEMSYLDIGIGMDLNDATGRIDDQTALPITFNGVDCVGCGVTQRSVKIDLQSILPGEPYKLEVSVGANKQIVEFNGGNTVEENIENINAALSEKFMMTPQVDEDGNILYIENTEGYEATELYPYSDADITNDTVLDISSLQSENYYSLEVSSNGLTRIIEFEGNDDPNITLDNIRKELEDKFGEHAPEIHMNGVFRDANGGVCSVKNASADYADSAALVNGDTIDLSAAVEGETYSLSLNGVKVTFVGGADETETMNNINEAMKSGLAFGNSNVPYINDDSGLILYDNSTDVIYVTNAPDSANDIEYSEHGGYSKNIIQLLLDSAKYLRKGDQDMVARYADLIYAAQAPLSVTIAELGTNDKFIEFNENRIDNIVLNLSDKQNDLEITDLPTEITNMKVLETIYNATLQMGAQMIPMSIFNYIS